MTPSWPNSSAVGRGVSHRESSLLPIDYPMTPSHTATHFFIAIQIRVNPTHMCLWNE
jgi:hypothetical protein